MTPASGGIIFIDADRHGAELLARYLQTQPPPARLVHLPDEGAALDFLARADAAPETGNRPWPGLVLLDLHLPDGAGLRVLRRFKESPTLHLLPVIALARGADDPDIGPAYRHQANSCLVKPGDAGELNRLFEMVRTYWLGWNRACPRPAG